MTYKSTKEKKVIKIAGRKYIVDENGVVLKEIKAGNIIYEVDPNKQAKNISCDSPKIELDFNKINRTMGLRLKEKLRFCYILYYMMDFLTYGTGELRYRNGKPLKISGIAKELGVSSRTVARQVKILEEEDIIRYVKGQHATCIYVNPWCYLMGTRVTQELYDMFKDSKWHTRGKEDE